LVFHIKGRVFDVREWSAEECSWEQEGEDYMRREKITKRGAIGV